MRSLLAIPMLALAATAKQPSMGRIISNEGPMHKPGFEGSKIARVAK